MFPFKSYRQALRVQHQHSGVSGICSTPPLTPQRSHGLQHYPGATQLIMGYISSESLQLLQALSSPTSHRLRKVSDSMQNPRDSVYPPETLGQQPERCLFVVLRSHHYNANLS